MKSLFISSAMGYSGKSLVAICLGKMLMEKGCKVGFFKPYGTLPIMKGDAIRDEDADCIAEYFDLKDNPEDICPIVLTRDLQIKLFKGKPIDAKEKILSAYKKVSEGKDLVLIGGGRTIFEGASFGYSTLDLAKETASYFLLIDRFDEAHGVDFPFYWKDTIGEKLLGIIINMVDVMHKEYLNKHIIPFLERSGVPVIGVMPKDEILSSISIKDIAEALGAQVHTAAKNLDTLIYHFMIGAMNLEAARDRFKKVRKKAVITGADRLDLQAVALESDTLCLILTGGMAPHPLILSKAAELHVPVLTVSIDTLTTLETVQHLTGRPRIREPQKIARALELFKENIDMGKLKLDL